MFKGEVAEKFQDELDDEMEQKKLINMIQEQEILKNGGKMDNIKKSLGKQFGSFMKKNQAEDDDSDVDSINSPRKPKTANFMQGL